MSLIVDPTHPSYRGARMPASCPTAFDLARHSLATGLAEMRAVAGDICADRDVEALHSYRVALRRIRSVLSLCTGAFDPAQTAELKTRMKALMAPTGPLRDLDVWLLAEPECRAMVAKKHRAGLALVFQTLRGERATALAQLQAHLRSPAYLAEITALSEVFAEGGTAQPGPRGAEPAAALGRALIHARYLKTCKRAKGLTAKTPDAEVHALRIACKRLRYLTEVFAETLPPAPLKSLVSRMKALQTALGVFNDAAVQGVALGEIQQAHPTLGRAEVQSIKALRKALQQSQIRARAEVSHQLCKLLGAKTQGLVQTLCAAAPPQGFEIERKFLVRDLPDLTGTEALRVRQGYLTALTDSTELRLRQMGNRYYLTQKGGAGRVRQEREVEITKMQFAPFWPATEGRRVEKTRWQGRLAEGHGFELDLFEGNLKGLRLVEVEFPNEAAAEAFDPPTWFGGEVTEDKRYGNKWMAVHGLPEQVS